MNVITLKIELYRSPLFNFILNKVYMKQNNYKNSTKTGIKFLLKNFFKWNFI